MFNSASALRSAIGSTLVFEKSFSNQQYVRIGAVEKSGYYSINITITTTKEMTITFEVLDRNIFNVITNSVSGKTLCNKIESDKLYFDIESTSADITKIKVEVNYLNSMYTSYLDTGYTRTGYENVDGYFNIDVSSSSDANSKKTMTTNCLKCNELQIGSWKFVPNGTEAIEIVYVG